MRAALQLVDTTLVTTGDVFLIFKHKELGAPLTPIKELH